MIPRLGARTLVAAAMAAALLGVAPTAALAQKPAALTEVRPIEVKARRIENFRRVGGTQQRFGRLIFRGGLVLTSSSPDFGGWSGLVIEPDGKRLLSVSDAGTWLTADLEYDGQHPSGLSNVRIGPIRAVAGSALTRSRDRDAEAVALLDGNLTRGSVLIAFEVNHRIGRFGLGAAGLSAPQGYLKRAPEFARMKPNVGIEAITVLRGGPLNGAVVAFAESLLDAQRNHTGWIWPKAGAGDPQRLSITQIGGFALTDAAALPDGGLLVLERYFRWTEGVKMRIRMIPAAEVKPGAIMHGETLIEADLTYEIDNMEGMSVHRGPRGETIITLISDDNFNRLLQRTVLLQFALVPAQTSAALR